MHSQREQIQYQLEYERDKSSNHFGQSARGNEILCQSGRLHQSGPRTVHTEQVLRDERGQPSQEQNVRLANEYKNQFARLQQRLQRTSQVLLETALVHFDGHHSVNFSLLSGLVRSLDNPETSFERQGTPQTGRKEREQQVPQFGELYHLEWHWHFSQKWSGPQDGQWQSVQTSE